MKNTIYKISTISIHTKSIIHSSLLIVGLLLANATSEALVLQPNANTWPQSHSDLAPDPRVIWGKLPNGIRYAIMPNNEPPKSLSLRLAVLSGSFNETEEQRGLAHFLEHMAFRGSKNFDQGQLIELLQRMGMGFGTHTNAHTSMDQTVYKLEIPDGKNDSQVRDGLKVLRDYADGLLLEQKAIDNERGVILAEKRDMTNSPEENIREEFFKIVFPDTLIPLRLPIGQEAVIQNSPRDLFVDFYNKWYSTDRMVVVATGNIDLTTAEKMIAEYFSSMKPLSKPNSNPDIGKLKKRPLAVKVYVEKEATKNETDINYVKNHLVQSDTKAFRIEKIKRSIPFNILSTRLERIKENPDAPFTKVNVYNLILFNLYELSGIELEHDADKWKKALAVAEEERLRMLKWGITDQEFLQEKAKLLNKAEDLVKQGPTRTSKKLSSDIADKLIDNEVFTSPEIDLALTKKALASVTKEECQKLFRNAWSDGNLVVFTAGNDELTKNGATTETLLAEFKRNQKIQPSKPNHEKLPPFAYNDFGKQGTVVDAHYFEKADLHQYRFSNNVRLNLKKTDFEADNVQVYVRIGGGLEEQPFDKEGLNKIASNALIPGGLQKHSKSELDRIFAGHTLKYEFEVSENAFNFMGITSKKDLLNQLKILTAYVVDPGYREEGFRITLAKLEETYRGLDKTPDAVYTDKVARFLASGDRRFGQPDKDKLFSRTQEELKNWISKSFKDGYIEITIIGDFDIPTALKDVSETFGALPLRAADKSYIPEPEQVSFAKGGITQKFPVNSDFSKAIALVVWPTDDIWNIIQARKLSLLSGVLSDRLRVQIRRDLGAAYSPYAYNDPSSTYKHFGRFIAFVEVDPKMAQVVVDKINDIAQDILKNGLTDDEFDRAKKPILTEVELQNRKNQYWLGSLNDSQEHPQRIDMSASRLDNFSKITKSDVEEVAKKFLQDSSGIKIIISSDVKEEPKT